MKLKTLKSLSLLALGFGLTVGCGGAPVEDTLPGDDAINADGAVSAQACPIEGCTGDDEITVSVSLKCVANYPFVGLEITNTSAQDVPSGATITYTAKYGYNPAVTRTTSGPLARGQTKIMWVGPIGGDYPLSCTASAKWFL